MTAVQMKYLLAYAMLEEKERSLTAIAIEFGVNKSTVSRVFSLAIKAGILDKKHKLTCRGCEYVENYRERYEMLSSFLIGLGIAKEYALEDAHNILANCSSYTIDAFLSKGK
ncbi:MAG: hypothetical protein Q4F05_19570 [bacterium]|nr:hypothetical protein [bacterium]